VLNAVKYLHDKKIVHRDIKPENILYEGGVVKLCDFGWATSWKDGKLGSFCGTLDYLSPEMAGKGQYDGSVDVWAVGVLAYELLTGKVPIKDADKERQIDKIAECDESKIVYPEEMEEQVRDFVHRFLRKEPSQRITLE
jgi:serine/threonine protein kinase